MAEEKGHSPVGASSRYRFRACPGSVNLCRKLPPSPSSSYAAEGTKAHEVAAQFLETGVWSPEADDEMIEHLKVYTNCIQDDQMTLNKSPKNLVLFEHGFDLSMLHKDAWGTADCVIYDSKKKILYVYDLKYGQGIFVDAVENEQLEYYAVGAFLSLDLPCETVVLKIIQPRFENAESLIREHTFGSEKLIEIANNIEAEIKATDAPDAMLVAGDHCRFCPAAGTCPAIAKNAMAVAKNIFAPVVDGAYDAQALSDTLDKLPMLEAFIKQVREFAYAEAIKGKVPPNYKLVKKRPVRSFREDAGLGKFLSKVLDTEKLKACYTEPKPPEIKSPAQVEKIVPKAQHEGLAKFIFAESSGNKLVHVSEAGEPVLMNTKTIFSEITDQQLDLFKTDETINN